ncbi:hypothetical protein [Leifsonia aquatica]|uniref:hypothetical protein n=1 Tax=Leifsonia aquatica TaxID=144185 RepID=UPI00046A8332|nr:hypothetical protein [Leifsonia aquatica]
MTGYTSGKTTHDPFPWVGEPGHANTPNRYGFRETGEGAPFWDDVRFDPRPEYDNHNPILVAFREYAALDNFGHVSHLIVHQVREHLIVGVARAGFYEGFLAVERARQNSSAEQLEHARRVIDPLWRFTYPDDGYEEPAPEENFWDDRTTPLAYSEGDSKRDTLARRKDIAGQLLPERYRFHWDTWNDELDLVCIEHGNVRHLNTGGEEDSLRAVVESALEHEVQAHW